MDAWTLFDSLDADGDHLVSYEEPISCFFHPLVGGNPWISGEPGEKRGLLTVVETGVKEKNPEIDCKESRKLLNQVGGDG